MFRVTGHSLLYLLVPAGAPVNITEPRHLRMFLHNVPWSGQLFGSEGKHCVFIKSSSLCAKTKIYVWFRQVIQALTGIFSLLAVIAWFLLIICYHLLSWIFGNLGIIFAILAIGLLGFVVTRTFAVKFWKVCVVCFGTFCYRSPWIMYNFTLCNVYREAICCWPSPAE
jgi:hypothetical protein